MPVRAVLNLPIQEESMGLLGFGVAEMVLVLVLFGAALPAPAGKLSAPHDKAGQAVDYILPGAHVVLHANIEASLSGAFALLEEAGALRLVKASAELSQAFDQARQGVDQAFALGVTAAGMDFRKDLGSLTVSMRLDSEERVEMLARVRGRFGQSRLVQELSAGFPGSYEFRGTTLYPLPDSPPFTGLVTGQTDDTTIMIGPRKVIEDFVSGKKPGKSPVADVVKKYASDKATTCFYLALPDWVVNELEHEDDLVQVARYLKGSEYVAGSSGSNGATVAFKGSDAEVTRRISYLMRSAVSAVGMLEPMMDTVFYGLMGVAPLIPLREVEAEVRPFLEDEEGIKELMAWFKKRFAGKGKVTLDEKKMLATMELSNAGSIAGLLLPVALGAAGWSNMKGAQDNWDPGPGPEYVPEFAPEDMPGYVPEDGPEAPEEVPPVPEIPEE